MIEPVDVPEAGAGEVLRLALPTSAGMVNSTILQFLDSLLIAMFVGPAALSVVGIANIIGTFIAGQSGPYIEKRRGLTRKGRPTGRYASSPTAASA